MQTHGFYHGFFVTLILMVTQSRSFKLLLSFQIFYTYHIIMFLSSILSFYPYSLWLGFLRRSFPAIITFVIGKNVVNVVNGNSIRPFL